MGNDSSTAAKKHMPFVPPQIDLGKMGGIQIPDNDYKLICDLIYKKAGIFLNQNKKIMVESRLSSRLRELNLSDYSAYLEYMNTHATEMEEFINSLTTNKTDFFRENDHFDYLIYDVLPKIKGDKIRIWSAASSTGEEVYTLAIVLSEFYENLPHIDFKILGTDIDTSVLAAAERGIYKKDLLNPVRPDLVQKYFERGKINKEQFRVKTSLKQNIKFRHFNLVNDSFPVDMKFDVIFLRNVLIYFDKKTIQHVIQTISDRLKIGGYLFIGHSETLNGIEHQLRHLKMSIYYKER